MIKVRFSIGLVAIGLIFSACKKEGCTDSNATNYDEKAKKDNGSCTYSSKPSYEVPESYSFERNGSSSVSFSGQTTRMNMLGEMVTYLKSANTPVVSLDAQKLKNMYANENSPFMDTELNTATKQLKNKTAGGDVTIQAQFEAYFDQIATISAKTSSGIYDGSNGKSGVVQSGSKAYLLDSNGVEYTQYIEKGLMGACFYHQITNVYLGDSKMNVDNETIVEGKNYTKMEHHWDEAFGYFTNSVNFPNDGKVYWAKYCDKRNAELNCNETIMNAFVKGRAAITNKDLNTRDEQRKIIRQELEKVSISTAIYYLKQAKTNLTDDALRNHELSEAVMFIDAIRFGWEPSLSSVEIEEMKAQIGANFYTTRTSDIDAVIVKLEKALLNS